MKFEFHDHHNFVKAVYCLASLHVQAEPKVPEYFAFHSCSQPPTEVALGASQTHKMEL